MPQKKTVVREPAECETLYFIPGWYGKNVLSQSIAIGVSEKNYVSLIAIKIVKGDHSFVHFCFVENEVDLLIKGLVEAKERMKNFEE